MPRCGKPNESPELIVLDSTDPDVIADFAQRLKAQAIGDFRALSRRGRPALGISIDHDGAVALKRLLELLT